MTDIASSPTPHWRRVSGEWHLIARGEMVARLVRNEGGWLSHIPSADEGGWSCVDFHYLAHGKACMESWLASRQRLHVGVSGKLLQPAHRRT